MKNHVLNGGKENPKSNPERMQSKIFLILGFDGIIFN